MTSQAHHTMPETATVHVGTIELSIRGHGEEARIRDLDLARVLEFTDPHMIRRLIRRHVDSGRIHPLSVTVTETGGRPGTEYWLTKREALWITAHSGTKKSEDMLQEVINVFVLAEEGKLPAQRLTEIDVDRIASRVLHQVRAELDTRTVGDGVVIGDRTARGEILLPIQHLAKRLAAVDKAYTYKGHIAVLHLKLRTILDMPMNAKFACLSVEGLRRARAFVLSESAATMKREQHAQIASARQAPLPFERQPN